VGGRLGTDVCPLEDRDELRGRESPEERHPVVDPEVGGGAFRGRPSGAVADHGRAPVAVPQLRQREQEPLDVGVAVDVVPDVHEVRPLVDAGRPDQVVVDALGDDAVLADGRPDRLRGDGHSGGPAGGLPVTTGGAEVVVRVPPVHDDGRPEEPAGRGGGGGVARRDGCGVDHVRADASEGDGQLRAEGAGGGALGDRPVANVTTAKLSGGAVPPLRTEPRHVVAAGGEPLGDAPGPADGRIVAVGRRVHRDDRDAHTGVGLARGVVKRGDTGPAPSAGRRGPNAFGTRRSSPGRE